MIKRLLLSTALCLLTFSQLSAQQYTYLYDAAGNRTKVTLYKSSISSADSSEVNEPVSVIAEGQQFKLYPNPTKGQVTIECPGVAEDTKVICTIHDAGGKFISNAIYNGQQTIICDMSNKPDGLYIFQVKLQGKLHVLKVLKQ